MLHKNSYILGQDTVIVTEKVTNKTNKTIYTEIAECQEYDEVLDDGTVFATGTMEMTTIRTLEN